jgi:hypothetical protein
MASSQIALFKTLPRKHESCSRFTVVFFVLSNQSLVFSHRMHLRIGDLVCEAERLDTCSIFSSHIDVVEHSLAVHLSFRIS